MAFTIELNDILTILGLPDAADDNQESFIQRKSDNTGFDFVDGIKATFEPISAAAVTLTSGTILNLTTTPSENVSKFTNSDIVVNKSGWLRSQNAAGNNSILVPDSGQGTYLIYGSVSFSGGPNNSSTIRIQNKVIRGDARLTPYDFEGSSVRFNLSDNATRLATSQFMGIAELHGRDSISLEVSASEIVNSVTVDSGYIALVRMSGGARGEPGHSPYRGPFNADLIYNQGDIVLYSGKSYFAVGHPPLKDAPYYKPPGEHSAWVAMQGRDGRDAYHGGWDALTEYLSGDIVSNAGQLWALTLESVTGDANNAAPSGDSGWLEISGHEGPQGIQGEAGPPGPTGTQGEDGPQGEQGVQGQSRLRIFTRADSQPAIPTGGSVNVTTGVVTPPDGWSDGIPVGAGGIWFSETVFDPARDVADYTPDWSVCAATGVPGPQGAPGEPGPIGPQGEVGSAGPQGIQGETGPAGKDGEVGGIGLTLIGERTDSLTLFQRRWSDTGVALPSEIKDNELWAFEMNSDFIMFRPDKLYSTSSGGGANARAISGNTANIQQLENYLEIQNLAVVNTIEHDLFFGCSGIEVSSPTPHFKPGGNLMVYLTHQDSLNIPFKLHRVTGGLQGDPGAQGISYLRIYRYFEGTPSVPTGGKVKVSDGTVTAPGRWSSSIPALSAGTLWFCETAFNPVVSSVDYEPTWSPPAKTGIEGKRGETGPPGERGQAGADSTVPGPPGPQGERGERGEPGQDGADSTVPGPRGPQGQRGPAGQKGERGPAGRDGMDGEDGMPGPAGEHGPRGLAGLRGERGSAGQDGQDGAPGPQGIRGERGPTGQTGQRGPQGLQGPQGLRGPKGEKGDRGPAGTGGSSLNVSTLSTVTDAAKEDLFLVSDISDSGTLKKITRQNLRDALGSPLAIRGHTSQPVFGHGAWWNQDTDLVPGKIYHTNIVPPSEIGIMFLSPTPKGVWGGESMITIRYVDWNALKDSPSNIGSLPDNDYARYFYSPYKTTMVQNSSGKVRIAEYRFAIGKSSDGVITFGISKNLMGNSSAGNPPLPSSRRYSLMASYL